MFSADASNNVTLLEKFLFGKSYANLNDRHSSMPVSSTIIIIFT